MLLKNLLLRWSILGRSTSFQLWLHTTTTSCGFRLTLTFWSGEGFFIKVVHVFLKIIKTLKPIQLIEFIWSKLVLPVHIHLKTISNAGEDYNSNLILIKIVKGLKVKTWKTLFLFSLFIKSTQITHSEHL